MWPAHGLPLLFPPAALLLVTTLQVACFLTGASGLGIHVPSGPEWPAQSITALLAHADATHLFSNMASQIALGSLTEGLHGSARFVVVYLGGGALGAASFRAAWRATDGVGKHTMVGASPAIYALVGAQAAHVILNWKEVPLRRTWLAAVAATAVVDVTLYFTAPLSHVAYSSHLGGAAFGALIGLISLRNIQVLSWEIKLRQAAALFLLVGIVLLV